MLGKLRETTQDAVQTARESLGWSVVIATAALVASLVALVVAVVRR